jgi:hypothetical protein
LPPYFITLKIYNNMCEALITITKSCDNNSGGIKRIYINLQDNVDMDSLVLVDPVGTGTPDQQWTIGTLDLVAAADPFIEFEFRRNTSGYTEESNIDLINGSSFVTQTINLMFHRREAGKSNAIKVLGSGQQYLSAIVEDQNGILWFFPYLQLTASGEGSGTARADGSKYSVTLLAENDQLAYAMTTGVLGVLLTP